MGDIFFIIMRHLKKAELTVLGDKLINYIGLNWQDLIEKNDNILVLIKTNVYLVPKTLSNLCFSLPRKNVIACGLRIGKFNGKLNKFRLGITALDLISKYCSQKIWLKPEGVA